MSNGNTQRLAKNTFALNLRMLLSIAIAFYTSRVILNTLGIEDYGIYNIVGGVVAMFTFLNSAMSGATSRFLTFELGKGDLNRLKETFSSALIIHIGIAIIIFIIAETIGIWFLETKLVIPESRMHAARWAYQFSILSTILMITQAPYNACIIAHERMTVYAYIEILNVSLKLLVVYLLVIGDIDKLIFYSFLVFCSTIIISLIYRIYCIKHFNECHFQKKIDKTISQNLISFSAYNLFSNIGWTVNQQGTNFALNIFYGVLYNAGASVATTVSNTVTGFSSNVMTAFRPQITKAYAQNNTESFENYLLWAIKLILIIYSLLAIPAFVLCDQLLSLWLIKVPPCASIFCRLMLLNTFFETIRYIIIMGIHATGRVKSVSMTNGMLFCLNPFIVYFLLYWELPPQYAYISIIFINAILASIDLRILKRQVNTLSPCKILKNISRIILIVIITYTSALYIYHISYHHSLVNIIYTTLYSTTMMTLLSYYLILNSNQKQQVISFLRKKLS